MKKVLMVLGRLKDAICFFLVGVAVLYAGIALVAFVVLLIGFHFIALVIYGVALFCQSWEGGMQNVRDGFKIFFGTKKAKAGRMERRVPGEQGFFLVRRAGETFRYAPGDSVGASQPKMERRPDGDNFPPGFAGHGEQTGWN
jgi:hypothetical protein